MNSRVQLLEGEFIDGDSTDPDLDAAFSNFRDSLKEGGESEGSLSAYKVPTDATGNAIAKSAKQAWLFTCPIDTVSLTDIIGRIKREFMRDGELSCIVRLTGHRPGKRGNEFNKIIRIEKENEAPRAAPASGSPDVAALMRSMQDMMNAQQQRSDTFMAQMMKMQMEMAALRAAPVASAANNDPMAFMERMVMMQATMKRMEQIWNPGAGAAAGALAPADPFAQMFAAMRAMKQMQSLMGGEAPTEKDDGSILGNLTKLAGPFAALMAETEKTKRLMIEKGMVRRIPRQPAAVSAGQPAPEPVAPAATATTDEPGADDMDLSQIRSTLSALCDMARDGTTPRDAANLVLDQIPEEADPQIADLVAEENKALFATKINAAFSGCKVHAQWFEELRQHLDAAYESDPDALNS